MLWRRPIWLWVAAGFLCLAGVFVGPAIMATGLNVWAAFQPRAYVSGWDIIALLALMGLGWLGATFTVARRLGGRTGLLFAVIAIGVAGGTVVFERAQPPSETTQRALTGDEAAAWRDFRP
jgi:hypothetical protein